MITLVEFEAAAVVERVEECQFLDNAIVTFDPYAVGRQDYAVNNYNPPHYDAPTYNDYLRGHNDAWAEATGRTSWQRAR